MHTTIFTVLYLQQNNWIIHLIQLYFVSTPGAACAQDHDAGGNGGDGSAPQPRKHTHAGGSQGDDQPWRGRPRWQALFPVPDIPCTDSMAHPHVAPSPQPPTSARRKVFGKYPFEIVLLPIFKMRCYGRGGRRKRGRGKGE